jgi:Zn-dependent peptidase ImmA (M78 family)
MHGVPCPDQEEQADRFAAEFLMPAKEIRPYLQPLSIQKAAALKPYWKTSMAAIIKRAFDLGLIGESYYRKLFTQLSKLGYRTAEPAPLADEEPSLLQDVVRIHLQDHKYSVAQLSSHVKLNEHEFRSQYLPHQRTLRIMDG